MLSFLTVVSCYDDSALRDQIEEHESQLNEHAQRLDSLETLCARLNTNYASLKKIVDALESNDCVTGVAPIMEGTETIGYTLTFRESGSVTIYNGRTPQMKVEEGNWFASYDGGKTWVKIGAADLDDGESYIENVRVDAQYMYITLSDGKTEIKIPLTNLPPVMTVEPGYSVAIFRGKAFPTSPDYKVGVVVGESEEEVKEIIAYDEFLDDDTMAYDFAEDGSFEIGADCHGDCKNFYRTFVYANGVYTWSDLMTFESNNAVMEYEVSNVTACSALVNGKIQLKFPDDVTVLVGYGETEDRYGNYWNNTEVEAELAPDGTFSVTLENLRSSMMYRCWLVVRYDDKYEDDQTNEWLYDTHEVFETTSNNAKITAECVDISAHTAVIKGNVALDYPASVDVRVECYGSFWVAGYESLGYWNNYSTYTFGMEPDENGDFEYKLEWMRPEHPYECRVVVDFGTERIEGELLTFTTVANKVTAVFETSDLTYDSVTIKGNVKLEYPFDAPVALEYRVAREGEFDDDGYYSSESISLDEEGNFEVSLQGLRPMTEYQCRVNIAYGGLYSDVWSFTMPNPYDQTFDLNGGSATDLSSAASANCYIVTAAGLYKFQAVKGNDKSQSVYGAASASILWESVYDIAPNYFELINAVEYEDGYVVFKTVDSFKEGNALLAVKDADGNILWSWHIWLTDQPQGQTYYKYVYDEANSTWDNPVYYFTDALGVMMDRNLGAVTATPGESGIYGLLYQWGRKDPFLGETSFSAVGWPSSVVSTKETGTIEYVTANPTTYVIRNEGNYDWFYSAIKEETDNTRWQSEKTIYDPCPAGWRVPDGGSGDQNIWREAGFDEVPASFDSSTDCMTFPNNGTNLYYPASGYRYDDAGGLSNVGYYGYYWSASPYSNNGYYASYLDFNSDGRVHPSGRCYYRAYGQSVRCLQE